MGDPLQFLNGISPLEPACIACEAFGSFLGDNIGVPLFKMTGSNTLRVRGRCTFSRYCDTSCVYRRLGQLRNSNMSLFRYIRTSKQNQCSVMMLFIAYEFSSTVF